MDAFAPVQIPDLIRCDFVEPANLTGAEGKIDVGEGITAPSVCGSDFGIRTEDFFETSAFGMIGKVCRLHAFRENPF